MLITLFARKNEDGSVSVFDAEFNRKATWDKFSSTKPTKRNKRIMLNCWCWSICWIN